MKKKIIILLFLLTFPSVFYVVLTTGKANFIHLPFFGEKILAPNKKDTIYHSIPSFKFINQAGDSITDKTLEGKIYIASFFNANCNTITCQKVATELIRVQGKFMYNNDNVKIISFTSNPETDTLPALLAYSKMVHAENKMWSFVTGDKNQITNLAKNGYLFYSETPNDAPTDSLHNERLILIDREKHIRGYYDATNIKQVNNLLDDVKVLIAENYIKDELKKDKLEKEEKLKQQNNER